MGGSGGGGGYFRNDVETIKQQLRNSEDKTEDAAYEAAAASLLSELLADYNDRDYDAVNRHLSEIKNSLEKDIEGTVNLLFGGSVAKRTYVEGFSDIDALVVINNSELIGKSPLEVKRYFEERLIARFPNTDIHVGTLAVTVRFKDSEIQLLPAIKADGHLKIADVDGCNWSKINPSSFTDVLSHVNAHQGNKVVPVVKLAKAIIANLPAKHQISGYHAESLAVEIFKDYDGKKTHKAMLRYFFENGAERVRAPITDRTGQSVHVDEYLGTAGSLERRVVSDAFSRTSRKMANADHGSSIEAWQSLFGE